MLSPHLQELTRGWGASDSISLYLDRCQVDTPESLVSATWKHVLSLRKTVDSVIDFGAGDGRFAIDGNYKKYTGYEIDSNRCAATTPSKKIKIVNKCAFSETIRRADLCIGNPPFVRNQDLPVGWRQKASLILSERTGVSLSGLANAWQYFFLLSLCSVKKDGLCALILPYEWVSRPAAGALRKYIQEKKWSVNVYRLVDATFKSVLTTSSITIIDKRNLSGVWNFFEETSSGIYKPLLSPCGSSKGVIPYARRSEVNKIGPRAIRGLSPGTQKILTLTEGERVHAGLRIGRDVIPCVTTLRSVPPTIKKLTTKTFTTYFKLCDEKCWLINTNSNNLSKTLEAYLNSVPATSYQTSTCLNREIWWKFKMPKIPDVLMAMSFREKFPKALQNEVGAIAVGGVCGVYNLSKVQTSKLVTGLDGLDLRRRVVAYSHGLKKIEINQMNTLLIDNFKFKQKLDAKS